MKERVDSWAARSALPPWDAALIVSVGALLVAAVTIGPPMWARAALALVVLAYLTSRAVQMAENPEEAQNRNWALAGEPTVRLRSKQLQIPIPAWIWVVALAGGIVALGPAWGTPVGFGFAVFWALVRVEGSRSASLYNLMESAKAIPRYVGKAVRVLARGLVTIAEYVFGYPVAHPFIGRYDEHRNNWS